MAVFENTVLRCARRGAPDGLDSISISQPGDYRLMVVSSYSVELSPEDLTSLKCLLESIRSDLSHILGTMWNIAVEYSASSQTVQQKPLLTVPKQKWAEQTGTGQPATCPVDEPEGADKPQPEAEGRSR
jgi:hypothetical protein